MKQLADLFDALLVYTASYPITLWNLLFRPARVFGESPGLPACPASVCCAISLTLMHLALQIENPDLGATLPPWASQQFILVFFLIYVAVIANLQRYAIQRLCPDLRVTDARQQLSLLVYPVSLLMALSATSLWIPDPWEAPHTTAGVLAYVWALYNVCNAGLGLRPPAAALATVASFVCYPVASLLILLFMKASGLD